MKNKLLLFIIFLTLINSNPKAEKKSEYEKKPTDTLKSRSYKHTSQKTQFNYDSLLNSSLKKPIISENKGMRINHSLSKLKDSCKCIQYNFSERGKPILENSIDGYHFIVCGYSGNKIFDTIVSGKQYSDGSVYLSGFEIFECNILTKSIFSNGEYHIDKVEIVNNRIEVSRCLNLPTGKNWEYNLSPIFKIRIDVIDNEIKLDTLFVLDISNISDKDIEDFKNGVVQLRYPENEIHYSLITAIKEYPTYNEQFYNLGSYDGYLGPIYNYAKEYFKIFDKQMRNKKNTASDN